jgi:S1-C subfamily serine protease
VAVIFADTRAWLPAHVVRIAADADLALLRLDREGHYPVVAGVAPSADRVRVGAPVALLGYPLGTGTAMEGSGTNVTARSTLGVGTVSKFLADVVQVDAYAGEGSSGSPVFDERGHVVGVVYGGPRDAAGRIVYAVPSERLLSLLGR